MAKSNFYRKEGSSSCGANCKLSPPPVESGISLWKKRQYLYLPTFTLNIEDEVGRVFEWHDRLFLEKERGRRGDGR